MDAWHELFFKTQIEQLITEREGMIAENRFRVDCGNSIAYGEDAFQILAGKFASLEQSIRNLKHD